MISTYIYKLISILKLNMSAVSFMFRKSIVKWNIHLDMNTQKYINNTTFNYYATCLLKIYRKIKSQQFYKLNARKG